MDTTNKFLVSVKGDEIVILRPINIHILSKEEALNLATWLLVLSGTTPEEREAAIAEVENT